MTAGVDHQSAFAKLVVGDDLLPAATTREYTREKHREKTPSNPVEDRVNDEGPGH
jgi:hypothetical protein